MSQHKNDRKLGKRFLISFIVLSLLQVFIMIFGSSIPAGITLGLFFIAVLGWLLLTVVGSIFMLHWLTEIFD